MAADHGAAVKRKWAHWDLSMTPSLAVCEGHTDVALLLLAAGAIRTCTRHQHDRDVFSSADIAGTRNGTAHQGAREKRSALIA